MENMIYIDEDPCLDLKKTIGAFKNLAERAGSRPEA